MLRLVGNCSILDPPLSSPQSSLVLKKVELSAPVLEILVCSNHLLALKNPHLLCFKSGPRSGLLEFLLVASGPNSSTRALLAIKRHRVLNFSQLIIWLSEAAGSPLSAVRGSVAGPCFSARSGTLLSSFSSPGGLSAASPPSHGGP